MYIYFWQLNTEGSYPRVRPHVWTSGNASCLVDGITQLPAEDDNRQTMQLLRFYDLAGRQVATAVSILETNRLSHGLYVSRGKKMAVK